MGKVWQSVVVVLGACAVLQAFSSIPVEAGLSPFYYLFSCPLVLPITAAIVQRAILNETRIAGSLLRLHFHDCFVQGCDGSILLVGNGTVGSTEQDARPNNQSVRGFGVIDKIKTALEKTCPGVVSCADIVALASFFSVVLSGGPIWPIPLGRRDSLISRFDIANDGLTLPAPFFNFANLTRSFDQQNLSSTDLVALSGGHTIGRTKCLNVYGRLYPTVDPTLNATVASSLEQVCLQDGSTNQSVTVGMDAATPAYFDNFYFKGVLTEEAVFASDNSLLNDTETRALVNTYANNQLRFFVDFAHSMIKMGNLQVLTGTQGEIRQVCSKPNPSGTQSVIEEVIEDGKRSRPENVVKEVTAEEEESFKDLIKDVVKELGRSWKRLDKLIEETVGDGMQSYM